VINHNLKVCLRISAAVQSGIKLLAAHVLRPIRFPEKSWRKYSRPKTNRTFPSEMRLSEKESRQPKCVKLKMKVRKLKSGANWQSDVPAKSRKKMG